MTSDKDELLVYSVNENSKIGTIIGNPTTASFYSPFEIHEFQERNIEICKTSGVIMVVAVIDREKRAFYSFLIISANGDTRNLRINIRDENDNVPMFNVSFLEKLIPENYPIGSKVDLTPVYDLDESFNSVQSIKIVSGDIHNQFGVDYYAIDKGKFNVRLLLKKTLDFETMTHFNIVIDAVDGGSPPLRSSLMLKIIVENANDNTPQFVLPRYIVAVKENQIMGEILVQVRATDKDSGLAGKLTYVLDKGGIDSHLFQINPDTGDVSLNGSLDYEMKRKHSVIVVVRDNVQPYHTSSTVLFIDVIDINDNPPSIQVTWSHKPNEIDINSASHSLVAHLTIHDLDSLSTHFTLNITTLNQTSLKIFKVLPTMWELKTTELFKNDAVDNLPLTFTATDYPPPSLTTTQTFTIRIRRHGIPASTLSRRQFFVEFKNPIIRSNEDIITIAISEPGSSNVAELYFSLTDDRESLFLIDERSGRIISNKPIDCGMYILNVSLHSKNPSMVIDSAKLTVLIKGMVKSNLYFQKGFYRVLLTNNPALRDNCPNQVTVANKHCRQRVKYILVALTTERASDYYITEYGNVCINREKKIYKTTNQRQLFRVIASEKGSVDASTNVLLIHTDRDNNNLLMLTNNVIVTVNRLNNSRPITRIMATMEGYPPYLYYGIIEYRFKQRTTAFTIDKITGEIYSVDTSLQRGSEYVIEAEATIDKYNITSQSVNVTVSYCRSQKLTESFYEFYLSQEKVANGTVTVGQVTMDTQSQRDDPVTYLLKKSRYGKMSFIIDSFTGWIKVENLQSRHLIVSLTVVAKWKGVDSCYAQVLVMNDEVRSPPRFPFDSLTVNVWKNSTVGSEVLQVVPSHSSWTDYYSLSDERFADWFSIHPKSGVIFINKTLTTAVATNLTVALTNRWGSTRSNVVINILDNKADRPSCNHSAVNITMNDTTAIGFVTCLFSDPDSLLHANFTYHLKMLFPNGINSPLRVNKSTGCLEVVSSLELWKIVPSGRFVFSLLVSHNGRDGDSDTRLEINLNIFDSNNHKPFVTSYPVFHLQKSTDIGTAFGILLLEDEDLHSHVTVQINDLHYSQWFSVESVNYKRTVLKTRLIKELRLGMHNIPLTIMDNGSPPQLSYMNVTLIVHDSNNHDPVINFPYENQNVSFPCPSMPGTKVFTVEAHDLDSGINSNLNYFLRDDKRKDDVFVMNKLSGVVTSKLAPLCSETRRLEILVHDNGYPRRHTSVRFFLSPDNRHEEFFKLINTNITFVVPDNARSGMVLGILNIEPWSTMLGAKYLFDGSSTTSSDGLLHIDYDNQNLTLLTTGVNFMTKFYPITVVCHKVVVPPRSVSIHLELNSNQLSNTWPIFLNPITVLKVKESQPPGTVVERFSTMQSSRNSVSFMLRQPNDYFVIDPTSGELLTFISLDREEMIFDEFSIEITATDVSDRKKSVVLPVQVFIEDINDNAPIIIIPVNSTIMVTNVGSKNYSIATVVAVDLDKGRNSELTYSIYGDDRFSIDPKSGALWLLSNLAPQIYEVNVSVSDHGLFPLSSWRLLTIYIQHSEAENKIRFSANKISLNLSLPSANGRVSLGRVTVTPSASYSNLEVRFKLISGRYSNLFEMDAVKGDISPSRSIAISDTGSAVVLKLSVIAHLLSDMSVYDTAIVLIHIDHGNNHAPSFHKSKVTVKLPEGEPITDFLTMAAHDPDFGVFGLVRYQLLGDVEDRRISIDQDTGIISCSALHYMTKKSYNLEVVATDSFGGPQSKNKSAFVQVLVQSSQKQLIEFSSAHFIIHLMENQPRGTIVGIITVRAKPIHSEVVYLLSPGHPLISINTSNGQLETNGPIDRENVQFIKLVIQAISVTFGSQTFHSAVTSVTIEITDENDNAPVPPQNPIIVRILNPNDIPSSLVTLTATDSDSVSNFTFLFNQRDHVTRFLSTHYHLDPISGILKYKHNSLQTTIGQHLLCVLISDNGTPPQRTIVLVHVWWNKGMGLLQITPGNAVFRLLENSSVGTFIGQVYSNLSCTADKISFSVIDGIYKEDVYMQATSGGIYVSRTIDREQHAKITLWIRAQCLESNVIEYTTVVIYIDDLDDNSPLFTQKEYISFIVEGQPPKTTVVRTVVYDPDEGVNGQVEYFIELYSSLDEFSIDPDGTIRTNIPLNFHTKSLYNLIVKATSKSIPLLFAECRVTVHVININDQRPIFSLPFQNIKIPEDKAVGSILTTITATDSDGPNGIFYRIRPRTMTNATNFLSVAYDSGDVYLFRKLRSSDRGRYELEVVADDGKFSSSAILYVDVTDINNEYPSLLEDGYSADISDTMAVGSTVFYLHALDRDSGINGEVDFEIFPSVPWLGIRDFQNNTAALYLISEPKYSDKVQFIGIQLTDRARDPARRLSSVSALVLLTESSNPHSPQFLNGTKVTLNIQEFITIGSKVMSVHCIDREDQVTYWINSSTDTSTLQIDSVAGDIFITNTLDNYPQLSFQVAIICQDNGKPQRKTTLILEQNVERRKRTLPRLNYFSDDIIFEIRDSSQYPFLIANLRSIDKSRMPNITFRLISSVPDDANMYVKNMSVFSVDDAYNLWLDMIQEPGSWHLIFRMIESATNWMNTSDLYQSSYMSMKINILAKRSLRSNKCVITDKLTAVIKENESPGTTVLNLPMWYNDTRYIFENDKHFLVWCDDKSTFKCQIQTTLTLDFEKQQRFNLNLTVIGTISTHETCSHTITVLIHVLDADEYVPIFSRSEYSFSVPGGVPKPGKVLFAVHATDNDEGRFGLVFYQLAGDENEHFAIGTRSGEIYLKASFLTVHGLRPRSKRSVNKEHEKPYRKTFVLIVIASSGEKISKANIRLSILVPFNSNKNEGKEIFVLLTATRILFIIGVPTSVVVISILLVVFFIIWRRRCFHCHRKPADGYYHNSGTRPHSCPSGSMKYSNGNHQHPNHPPLPPRKLCTYNNELHHHRMLPDVTLLALTHPRIINSLTNSETQEFCFNSDENLQTEDKRNASVLSYSSITSSIRLDESSRIASARSYTNNICICNNENVSLHSHKNDLTIRRINGRDVKAQDSDLSGASSSCYSLVSQNQRQLHNPPMTMLSSVNREQRSINTLRDGPIDYTMISRNKPESTTSSGGSPESVPLRGIGTIMKHDYDDNHQIPSSIQPSFVDRMCRHNVLLANNIGCNYDPQSYQIIPPPSTVNNSLELSQHHDNYNC